MPNTIVKELNFYRNPGDFFPQFADDPYVIFLDSSLENEKGRYAIIGLHPCEILEETDGICRKNNIVQKDSLEKCLQQTLLKYKEDPSGVLPFISGMIGYFSYDYGKKFEQIPDRHPKKLQMPDALFICYNYYIIADLKKQKLYLTSHQNQTYTESDLKAIEHRILAADDAISVRPVKHKHTASFSADFTKEDYKHAIDRMISYIIEGDLYIGNMTQQLEIHSSKKPLDVFSYLRTYHPVPFGAYFCHPEFQIVCGSMERFLQIENSIVTTVPIKGTRKRGETPDEDLALRKELEMSEKDHSELLMIMDLERNDFSRICKPNSIQVKQPFFVDAYATVFHLSSIIEGELLTRLDPADLIPSVFPGGSITGAPKIRAMEIIDELEHSRRGLYTGSIGYFSFSGNCDLNIVIRTAVHQNGTYHMGVGGGITCESDLEFEYGETLQKAQALLEAAWEGDQNA